MSDDEIVKYLVGWINDNTIYRTELLNLEIIYLTLEELQQKHVMANVQF